MVVTFFLALSVLSFFAQADIINNDVSRAIDASSAIVSYSLTIKAVGVEGSYDLMFPDEFATKLAYLECNEDKKKLEVSAPVTDGTNTIYTIKTGAKDSVVLKVTAIFTELLELYPAEIRQLDDQLVRLKDSHYFLTPYHTVNQKTSVTLASSQVESYTRLEPSTQRGSKLMFGPYKEIAALSKSHMSIHSVNNKPFAKLVQAEREIEISHWGNIAIEETFELRHAGAALKGGFSRFDYQTQRRVSSPSFEKLKAFLPLEARNIYYRDQIGNISTSDITATDTDLEIDIATRFPMFGAWKTEFYIGYDIPTEIALFVQDTDRYTLEFDFFTIFQDVWVENMEIKVILPEGCTDIDIDVPYVLQDNFTTKRFTYLDSEINGGRTVIVLRAKNVVEQHSEQVRIKYTFNQTRMLVEPFMLIAAFSVFFVCISIIKFLNTSTEPDGSENSKVAGSTSARASPRASASASSTSSSLKTTTNSSPLSKSAMKNVDNNSPTTSTSRAKGFATKSVPITTASSSQESTYGTSSNSSAQTSSVPPLSGTNNPVDEVTNKIGTMKVNQ